MSKKCLKEAAYITGIILAGVAVLGAAIAGTMWLGDVLFKTWWLKPIPPITLMFLLIFAMLYYTCECDEPKKRRYRKNR
jgi:uncharacterized BrkB/YihY/UPF0761 family membrane protein